MGRDALNTTELKLITFDCYGTLIDWESGIRRTLQRQLQSAGREWEDRFFDLYLEREALHESAAYRPYREVLAAAEADVLTAAGVNPLPKPALADSLPDWKPFADTLQGLERLREKYKLGVLSNIDRDLFARTARHLGVKFDIVVTAEDVQYYKPGPAHFNRMLEQTGLNKSQVLHAAQSLYHDVAVCNELNIPCVWINRRGEENTRSARPIAEFPDLPSFASAVL